ncbi:MAG: MFS transporter [Chloroflexi bacterium]|nr:MFS transporter [Chloroflexota bacterium]
MAVEAEKPQAEAVPGSSWLRTFRNRDFSLLWLYSLCSYAGMAVQQVAVSWLVLEMTDSPFSIGVVNAARMAAFLLLGLPAGALADRLDRRKLLMGVSVASTFYAVALALLVVARAQEFWHVTLLTFLFGCTRALEAPPRQALVYDLVGPEEALRGISLNGLALPLTAIAGGVLGGALIPAFGVQGSLLLMAGAYAAALLALAPMRPPSRSRRLAAASFWRSVADGLGMIKRNRRVRDLVLLSMTAEVFAFSHQTLVPVFARDILNAGPTGLGLLTGARGLGAFLATLVLARLTYHGDKVGLLLWAYCCFGVFLMLFALSRDFLPSLALMVAIGGAATSFDLLQQTIIQASVSEEERGRAMGYWVASLGAGPVGHMELGAISGLLGAPLALAGHGGVVLAIVALAWRLRGRRGTTEATVYR